MQPRSRSNMPSKCPCAIGRGASCRVRTADPTKDVALARAIAIRRAFIFLLAVALTSLMGATISAKDRPRINLNTDELAEVEANDREKDFYRIVDLPLPATAVVEAGSILGLPQSRIAVGTRRGDVFIVDHPDGDPAAANFRLFASGMTEILGLAFREDR